VARLMFTALHHAATGYPACGTDKVGLFVVIWIAKSQRPKFAYFFLKRVVEHGNFCFRVNRVRNVLRQLVNSQSSIYIQILVENALHGICQKMAQLPRRFQFSFFHLWPLSVC